MLLDALLNIAILILGILFMLLTWVRDLYKLLTKKRLKREYQRLNSEINFYYFLLNMGLMEDTQKTRLIFISKDMEVYRVYERYVHYE